MRNDYLLVNIFLTSIHLKMLPHLFSVKSGMSIWLVLCRSQFRRHFTKNFFTHIFLQCQLFFSDFKVQISVTYSLTMLAHVYRCLRVESPDSSLQSSVLSNKILYANVLSFFECTNWYCLCCGIFPRSSNVVYQK